jgi:hypothetical protein
MVACAPKYIYMKKVFFLMVVSMIAASCSKHSTTPAATVIPAQTITATIDGTNYTFNQGGLDSSSTGPLGPEIVLIKLDASGEMGAFAVESDAAFVPKVYGANGDIHSMTQFGASLQNINYTSASPSSNPMIVTVTAVTPTSIQGTFQGNIYLNGDTTKAVKVVTNGQFNYSK